MIERLFDTIEEVQQTAHVSAVFGKPVQVGERTVIPVAKVKYGFGLGFGKRGVDTGEEGTEAEGASGGGGIVARPIAVIEVTPDRVRVEPVLDEGRIALAGIFAGLWAIFWSARTLQALFGRRASKEGNR